ncbi:hypothetical protein OQA88_7553 [Cercophora sp. LCS_1]
MAEPYKLRPLSASKLSVPATDSKITCNPVIDLASTIGDEGKALYIWRANDQLVSKHTENGQKAEAVKWKEDGTHSRFHTWQFVAVGWSDGVVRLVGLESSKAVHHIPVCNTPGAKINIIAWSRNVTDKTSTDHDTPSKPRPEDIIPHAKDLPHELTFLEIDTALPKISPLPVSGGSGYESSSSSQGSQSPTQTDQTDNISDDVFVFSTTASIEFVFRPIEPENANAVHVMIAGTTDGGIHITICDSFAIGNFKYSPQSSISTSAERFQLCGHGSHPLISSHVLLFKAEGGDAKSFHLVPLDLTFVHYSPVNLLLLASKMTTMQNLLRYLKQAQSHMTIEWKSTRELPARFLNAVREDLEKMDRGPITIVQALYHTVLTGHVFAPLKEWLVDSLAERGHKRWEKAVVTGLENLRALVHENFIPALERCGIILSRLLGIARFHDSQESIGFTAAQITKLMDIVSCLTVVAHKIQLIVMDELEHFNVFSAWLRLEIDKLASSALSDELTEKEATMDTGKVLAYIQKYLETSPLSLYFDAVTTQDYTNDEKLAEAGTSLLDILDKQLKNQEAGKPHMKALPNVGFLVNYLTSRTDAVFRAIAEAEKRTVRFGQGIELSTGQKIWKHEMYMCSASKDGSKALTFTAFVSEDDKTKVHLFQTDIAIVNGISDVPKTAGCGIQLPTGLTVIDLKFLDDEGLLLLCKSKDAPAYRLLHVAYQSALFPYSEYKNGQPLKVIDIKAESNNRNDGPGSVPGFMGIPTTGRKAHRALEFAKLENFVPVGMDVQKASTLRGDIPGRVCLLGQEGAEYRVYALPQDWELGLAELTLDP